MKTCFKEWYGSLDGLDVSIDGLDVPPFINSLDIFYSFLEVVYKNEIISFKCLLSIKGSLLGPQKWNKHSLSFIRSFTVIPYHSPGEDAAFGPETSSWSTKWTSPREGLPSVTVSVITHIQKLSQQGAKKVTTACPSGKL